AMLFPAANANATSGTAQPGASVSLPGQVVDDAGNITIPYAGQVHVAGLTPSQIGARIAGLLMGKANHPQVLVQLAQNKA
ncbi:polysaccharide biosynthesis/export family protein, partial [Streptococcus mitis]|uniref:polysaccharide biosynthesis/export family protein n=2 Tax=Bacteria TaxID=2 RepID=UPI0021B837A7